MVPYTGFSHTGKEFIIMLALKRAAATVMLTVASIGVAVGVSSAPAQAAYPACWGYQYLSTFNPWVGYGTSRVPVAYNGSTTCQMGWGSNSEAVRVLQADLNFCYGQGIAVDADFGPQTYQALVNVQAAEGISADGVYGPQTRDHIWDYDGGNFCGKF